MTSRPSLVDKAGGEPSDEAGTTDALARTLGYFKLGPLNGNDTLGFIQQLMRDPRGKAALALEPGEVEELAEALCSVAPLVIELVVKGLLESKLEFEVGRKSGGAEMVGWARWVGAGVCLRPVMF